MVNNQTYHLRHHIDTSAIPLQSDDDDEVCIVQAPELKCDQAPWTRVNHLGKSSRYTTV